MKRESGYYWIKWSKDTEWEIAYYISAEEYFYSTNGKRKSDKLVFKTNENKITKEDIDVDDEVTVNSSDNEEEENGIVEYKTTIYFVKHDDDGEVYCYADLGNYSIFEVKNLDSIEQIKK